MKYFTDFFTGTIHSKAAHWMAAMAVATGHVYLLFSITYTAETGLWLIPLLVTAPALLTVLIVPGAWRTWYRWATLLFLTYAVYPELLAAVLAVGETWVLYRVWFLERDFPLSQLPARSVRRFAVPALPARPAAKPDRDPKFSDVGDILFKEHRARKAAKPAAKTTVKAPAGV